MGDSATRMRGAIGGLLGTIGLGGLGLGLRDTIRAGETWQAQQAQLQNALKNTGRYSAETMRQIMEAAERLSTHGGFGASDTLQGMTQFVRINGNARDAISKVTLATNIARSSGRDFTQVLRALMMAEQGRTTGLARLGVAIPRVTSAQDALRTSTQQHKDAALALTAAGVKLTSSEKARLALSQQVTPAMQKQAKAQDQAASTARVFALLQQRYGGSTAAYSRTTAGQISNARNAIETLSKTMAQRLLPTVARVATVGAHVITFLIKHKAIMAALGVTIGGVSAVLAAHAVITEIAHAKNIVLAASNRMLGTSFGVVAGAEEGATAATIAWGDAFKMTVAGAVIFAIIELVTHFKEVKKIAVEVFRGIVSAAQSVWHFLEKAGQGIYHALTWAFKEASHFVLHDTIWGGMFQAGKQLLGGHVGRAAGSLLHGATFGLLHGGGVVKPRYFASGGPVGSDTVPLWATPGEGMVTTQGMARIGGEAGLYAINHGIGGGQPIVLYTTHITKLEGKVLAKEVTRQVLNAAARGPSNMVGGSLVTGAPGL